MTDRDDPYEGRRRPRAYKYPPLREPTPQDGKAVSRHHSGARVGGDTSGWVHDGAGSPFSDAHVARKK